MGMGGGGFSLEKNASLYRLGTLLRQYKQSQEFEKTVFKKVGIFDSLTL